MLRESKSVSSLVSWQMGKLVPTYCLTSSLAGQRSVESICSCIQQLTGQFHKLRSAIEQELQRAGVGVASLVYSYGNIPPSQEERASSRVSHRRGDTGSIRHCRTVRNLIQVSSSLTTVRSCVQMHVFVCRRNSGVQGAHWDTRLCRNKNTKLQCQG